MARPSCRVIILSLCLFLPRVSQAASWASLNCTQVSYDTLETTREPSRWPFVGPNGLYAYTPSRYCMYLNGSLDGSFAQQNPKEFTEFMTAVQEFQDKSGPLDLEFMHQGQDPWPNAGPEPAGHKHVNMVRHDDVQIAGCGDVCNGDFVDTVICTQCYIVSVQSW
ncbi:hypothetical protein B0T26DRAFT_671459 [Lasiosphaeria miniovina]|uniref:Secreted protein n=1 Tax=Lasiosphaeria miniovina TaxID=1954250 RepID=A0AA40B312_9PEZI|nr:uncharacterized protein B0T26DRAFT_671459 [Lasiosphaeria miniovina]KAK0726690.1 hypothetical protein B0T26DRAFT_671459 [Lasiosphaeria miniovina]